MPNPASDKVPPPENGPTAALLSYLVPGLGQIYQGRVGKGVLFFVCVYTLFFYGLALGSWKNVYLPDVGTQPGNNPWSLPPLAANLYNRPHFVGQFWVGVVAWPAVYQYYAYDPHRTENLPLKGFERQPPLEELERLQRDGDKTWDLAWVYTVIAGVLNVMVIYDAYAGPAFVVRPGRKEEPSPMPPLPPPPPIEVAVLFAQSPSHLLYYVHVPVLLILISLVYSATRFDQWTLILREAVRWGLRLLLFLVIIAVVLYGLATVII